MSRANVWSFKDQTEAHIQWGWATSQSWSATFSWFHISWQTSRPAAPSFLPNTTKKFRKCRLLPWVTQQMPSPTVGDQVEYSLEWLVGFLFVIWGVRQWPPIRDGHLSWVKGSTFSSQITHLLGALDWPWCICCQEDQNSHLEKTSRLPQNLAHSLVLWEYDFSSPLEDKRADSHLVESYQLSEWTLSSEEIYVIQLGTCLSCLL